MKRSQIYLSTVAQDCWSTAKDHGLGIELAQFCTAFNIDNDFAKIDAEIRQQLLEGQPVIYHGPYNELFPCAIDPKARELAVCRYRQAISLAKGYGAKKVVIHANYHPWIYFPVWFVEQSIVFWKEFFREDPGIPIVLENVLETEFEWLPQIVQEVDHPNFRLCLDIGHVNAYSKHPLDQWLESWAPWISHFHIHNNDASWDTHSNLDQGTIPVAEFLRKADTLCPQATYTLELLETASAIPWLEAQSLLSG